MDMQTFLAIGGAIVLLGNIGAVISRVIKPSVTLQRRIYDLERHDKADSETILKLQKLSDAQCKMLLVMIDHMIDGNHVEKMKETRAQIIDLLGDQ